MSELSSNPNSPSRYLNENQSSSSDSRLTLIMRESFDTLKEWEPTIQLSLIELSFAVMSRESASRIHSNVSGINLVESLVELDSKNWQLPLASNFIQLTPSSVNESSWKLYSYGSDDETGRD
jgi:hypothetical protein